jgi:hypothetical protein
MYTFAATYTQAQGDEIAWVRWMLYNTQTETVIVDTGEIYGTSQLQFSYDALFAGTIYGIEITIETQSGQQCTSGIQTVNVSYSTNTESGSLIAEQKCEWNGISVSWEPSTDETTSGYSLYRLDSVTNLYKKIADLDITQTGIIDYSAKNGHTYTYQLWELNDTVFVQQPITSNQITPCSWNVLLIAAAVDGNEVYHPQSVYAFGSSVEMGEESNNSKNTVVDTFTGYPAYQQSSNLYRTGKLTAFIGKIDRTSNQYVGDTSDYLDELMTLTTSNLTMFIRDRKGNFREIKINGSVSTRVQSSWANQASTITIPWVEVADASDANVILTNTDGLWPYDEIADTTVEIDPSTGSLMWTIPDNYITDNKGSVLLVNQDGHLIQSYSGTVVQMADLSIDSREHLISKQ